MTKRLRLSGLLLLVLLAFVLPARAAAQTGTLRGDVVDPSGAVVPGASVILSGGGQVLKTTSSADGHYAFRSLSPGSYTLAVSAQGFAPVSMPNVSITAGQAKVLNLSLAIAVQQQQVTVEGQDQGVSLNPDQNASATVIKGSDLDALSDDPDELQSELQALAGPAAGPNGGQIYIDGFEGGQIPPKSSILEIRVNQNPFSAEYDRIGYGRIEIITKPGSQKFHGQLASFGTDSALDTKNPLVSEQPSYFLYGIFGNVTGPLTKSAAYFFNAFGMDRQNQAIVDALNPQDPTANFTQAFPTPSSVFSINPRVDFELGKNNMITVRDSIFRSTQTGGGVGTLSLPEQAIDSVSEENTLQVGETMIVNSNLVNETHFQWRRVRNSQNSSYLTPAITVQGSFTTGGNSSGVNQDHEDDFELQNYSTATKGTHTFRFGVRLRSYRDANYSTAGSNGTYIFTSVAAYQAGTPSQYSATVISNPLARALLFDGAAFFEDDWRVTPNFDLGLGIRFEGQNRIHDHTDWAPRLSLAWSPGHSGKGPAKTVLRAGYGWFYNRFTVPNFFGSAAGAPYVIQAIHNNLINQQSYVIDNPDFYNPNAAEPASVDASAGSSVPDYNTIDPHFHTALDMQGGVGVDRQIAKGITGNITYLYTQGVHQYFTDNITAPAFDVSSYAITGTTPAAYNYQFQSGGVYKEHQLIVTTSVRWKKIGLNGNYTFTVANSDTQGVTSQPSVEQDPGLDYGRASFGVRHRMFLLGTYAAPYKITVAPLLVAQSGTPYNLTIGRDFTGNNQFNARPTYGVCGAPNVVETQYGCLDTDPVGSGERMVPFDLATGPASVMFHVRVSKVIGVGPRIETKSGNNDFRPGNNSVSGRGLSGGGAPVHLDATAPRKYNLTFAFAALNVLNVVNLGPPNGVLDSPLFNKTQSLAGGPYSLPIAGNRAILFQMMFGF